jgi:hypothetical protein
VYTLQLPELLQSLEDLLLLNAQEELPYVGARFNAPVGLGALFQGENGGDIDFE